MLIEYNDKMVDTLDTKGAGAVLAIGTKYRRSKAYFKGLVSIVVK